MQYKASRAPIHHNGHSEARKNLTKIGAGNLGRNQSTLKAGPSYLAPYNELNNHRPSNPNKLFRHSFKITKLRLWILPNNVPVLQSRDPKPRSLAPPILILSVYKTCFRNKGRNVGLKTSISCGTYTRDL